jgi:hypothetical protein
VFKKLFESLNNKRKFLLGDEVGVWEGHDGVGGSRLSVLVSSKQAHRTGVSRAKYDQTVLSPPGGVLLSLQQAHGEISTHKNTYSQLFTCPRSGRIIHIVINMLLLLFALNLARSQNSLIFLLRDFPPVFHRVLIKRSKEWYH